MAAKVRRRFTDKDRDRVVRWLAKRANERRRVVWQDVEAFSGFSKMRMSRDPAVVAAFHSAKAAFRGADKRRHSHSSREQQLLDVIDRLEIRLGQMETERDQWCVLWDRWQYNAQRMGWDVSELERPLPTTIHRKIARGR